MLEYTDLLELTLLVRHLPSILTDDEKASLLKAFGAERVRVMQSRGHMKDCAFASFHDHASTRTALLMLHQLDVLGKRLVVTYARPEQAHFIPKVLAGPECSLTSAKDVPAATTSCCCEEVRNFVRQTNSITRTSRPAAQLPLCLSYEYPPANKRIIERIGSCLMTSVPFYVQVLHLMNKMNLPCPFSDSDSYAIPHSDGSHDMEVTTASAMMDDASSVETELSSEEEPSSGTTELRRSQNRPAARKISNELVEKRRKKLKCILRHTAPEAVRSFSTRTTSATDICKKSINIVVNSIFNQTSGGDVTEVLDETGSFGKFSPIRSRTVDLHLQSEFDFSTVFSLEWIQKRRLDKTKFDEYPVFKNYSHGSPSSRLYIKNVAKKVTLLDLKRIYGNFVDVSIPSEIQAFDVCLMTRGRLRGQAFVSLANVDQASVALRSTNGLMLYDQPIVVAFARSHL
ncbi:unnamed protein product [Soboliphyme baturini]|uniref:RNA-binding region-containing protein 3 n=1 Tax=Soboliphyme baturini TaxID=241478 RepID=A0A183IPJ4_9BILA|nr:unnamed protein product [Soboliphyme baturini]